MLSAGGKITPHVDLDRRPTRVSFTPKDRAAIKALAPKVERAFKMTSEYLKKLAPQYARLKVFDDAETLAGQIRQPQTAGPKSRQTYNLTFRVELMDRKGRIVRYHEMKARHPVRPGAEKDAEGRISRSFLSWPTREKMAVHEAVHPADRSRRLRVDLDRRDAVRMFATGRHMVGSRRGHSYRIVIIGGPEK
ncbi:MAG: hypothetical protein HN337_03745 [Deltaproteobacteria bacterium]|nr:hypothetical protein [Deltaproteobacteria bacterium]